MSDAAYAEPVSVPLDTPSAPSGSVGSQIPEIPEKPVAAGPVDKMNREAEKPSRRESIERAIKDAEVKARAPKDEAKTPEVKAEQQPRERTEQGKFAPKASEAPKAAEGVAQTDTLKAPQAQQATPPTTRKYEPPARFNEHSKAEWDSIPEQTQAEIVRATQNLEKGYEKHKESAERYDKISSYDERARANGGSVENVLQEVDRLQQTLRTNPIQGLHEIAAMGGFDIRQAAAHILGQPIPQQNHAYQQVLAAKDAEIARLTEVIQGEQSKNETASAVNEFAAQNPDFHEIRDRIQTVLETTPVLGDTPAERLANAYKIAKAFGAAQPAHQASPAIETTLAASPASPNPNGQKSINGSPTIPPKIAIKPKDGHLSRRDSVRNALVKGGFM